MWQLLLKNWSSLYIPRYPVWRTSYICTLYKKTCAASTAIDKLISTCHSLKDVGYNTYYQLYDSRVEPVKYYAPEIWGFKNTEMCNKVYENAMRFYLGVHKLPPFACFIWGNGLDCCQSQNVYWTLASIRHGAQLSYNSCNESMQL